MIIIDYQVGNIGSVLNMLRKIGVTARLSGDRAEIMDADRLILPGVGSFDNGMKNLRRSGLIDVLEEKILGQGTPVLGICLGMQLLMDRSEEGSEAGLGWIGGDVRRFDKTRMGASMKIPHMGWNLVRPRNYDGLFKTLEDEARFYFVHSYHACCADPRHAYGISEYGYEFTSAIHKANIYGVQFHPEKSHKFGAAVLNNFARLPHAA